MPLAGLAWWEVVQHVAGPSEGWAYQQTLVWTVQEMRRARPGGGRSYLSEGRCHLAVLEDILVSAVAHFH
jgi:hypothetical protein